MDKIINPDISIIVRTKNRASLLKEALESILNGSSFQKIETPFKTIEKNIYLFVEVVIVNDGGVCVGDLLHEVLDGKMEYTYLNFENGVGRSAAGNKGVEASRAPWIFFLDDDDILMPNGIAQFFQILKTEKSSRMEINNEQSDNHHHNEQLSNHNQIEEGVIEEEGVYDLNNKPIVYHGKVKALRYSKLGNTEEPFKIFATPFNADAMLWENHIPINALIIPKYLFLKTGGFDSSFSCFEDWDLLLRLSDIATFVFIPFFIAIYRIFDHSFIVGGGGEQWQNKGREVLYRKHWHRYSPDKMLKIYKAINKEMHGDFLPEMTLLKENIAKLEKERLTWTTMDHDREIYIRKLESYIRTLEENIRELEKNTRKLEQDWKSMDHDREIYIRKLEIDIKDLEENTRKRQQDWEIMDKGRLEYVNDLLRHIQNLEAVFKSQNS